MDSETYIRIEPIMETMYKGNGKAHICLLPEQVEMLEAFGKSRGLLTLSQTVEHLVSNRNTKNF
jgi:hypothetical protein